MMIVFLRILEEVCSERIYPLVCVMARAISAARKRVESWDMTMNAATFYLCASAEQSGALGIFHAYGPDETLSAALDRQLGDKQKPRNRTLLTAGELRYGWLWGTEGEILDEIMLGCPAPGVRVVMTHGGWAIREAVKKHFEENGFARLGEDLRGTGGWEHDNVLDVMLASCLTEGQAAAVLEYRVNGTPVPQGVLGTHRVVLAGAANAGKSSLLNCLCGYDRAFVDARAGATRDVVDELADVGGYALWLGDMPGYLGESQGVGTLEREAWKRAEERVSLAEWVWLVIDGSAGWDGATETAAKRVAQVLDNSDNKKNARKNVLIVINKSDLAPAISNSPWRDIFPEAKEVYVCSLPDGDACEKLGNATCEYFSSL